MYCLLCSGSCLKFSTQTDLVRLRKKGLPENVPWTDFELAYERKDHRCKAFTMQDKVQTDILDKVFDFP